MHAFWAFLSLQSIKLILFEPFKHFLGYKRLHSCFLSFFTLEIIQFIFFERFEACTTLNSRLLIFFKFTTENREKKWNLSFLSVYKRAKKFIHVFWTFQACKKWKPHFLSFFKVKNSIHFFFFLKIFKFMKN